MRKSRTAVAPNEAGDTFTDTEIRGWGTVLRSRSRGADVITFRHVGGAAVRFTRGAKGHVGVKVGGEEAFLDPDEVLDLIEFLAGPSEGWR